MSARIKTALVAIPTCAAAIGGVAVLAATASNASTVASVDASNKLLPPGCMYAAGRGPLAQVGGQVAVPAPPGFGFMRGNVRIHNGSVIYRVGGPLPPGAPPPGPPVGALAARGIVIKTRGGTQVTRNFVILPRKGARIAGGVMILKRDGARIAQHFALPVPKQGIGGFTRPVPGPPFMKGCCLPPPGGAGASVRAFAGPPPGLRVAKRLQFVVGPRAAQVTGRFVLPLPPGASTANGVVVMGPRILKTAKGVVVIGPRIRTPKGFVFIGPRVLRNVKIPPPGTPRAFSITDRNGVVGPMQVPIPPPGFPGGQISCVVGNGPSGPSGVSGATGPSGRSGPSETSGPRGLSGPSGPSGPSSPSGG